jgi:hypothetical protein
VPPADSDDRDGRGDHGEVVIDLTGTAYAPSAATLRTLTPRQRRTGMLGAVAAVAVVLAITNFAIGMQWRSVALDAQDRAVRATADVAAKQQAVIVAREARDVAELRREAMARQLAVSEADVAALEARVAALASDKARAEDYGAVTRVASNVRVRTLQKQLDSCIAQIAALRAALRVNAPESAVLDETANAAQAACEQVGADAAVLAAGE